MAVVEGKFPRKNRLLKPDEFRRVFDASERSADRLFVVFACPNGLQFARLGLAVSKKKAKRAVDRNRLKRVIRESFRAHQDILAGMDVVVLNQHGKVPETNHEYYSSLLKHWQRLAKQCVRS